MMRSAVDLHSLLCQIWTTRSSGCCINSKYKAMAKRSRNRVVLHGKKWFKHEKRQRRRWWCWATHRDRDQCRFCIVRHNCTCCSLLRSSHQLNAPQCLASSECPLKDRHVHDCNDDWWMRTRNRLRQQSNCSAIVIQIRRKKRCKQWGGNKLHEISGRICQCRWIREIP